MNHGYGRSLKSSDSYPRISRSRSSSCPLKPVWCIAAGPARTATAFLGPRGFPPLTSGIGIDTAIDAHCIADITTIIILGDMTAGTAPFGITGTYGIETVFCISSIGNSKTGWHVNTERIGERFDASHAVTRPNPICLAQYPEPSTE